MKTAGNISCMPTKVWKERNLNITSLKIVSAWDINN
jgi:hypothetical protein